MERSISKWAVCCFHLNFSPVLFFVVYIFEGPLLTFSSVLVLLVMTLDAQHAQVDGCKTEYCPYLVSV